MTRILSAGALLASALLTANLSAQSSPYKAASTPNINDQQVTLVGCLQPARVDPTALSLTNVEVEKPAGTSGRMNEGEPPVERPIAADKSARGKTPAKPKAAAKPKAEAAPMGATGSTGSAPPVNMIAGSDASFLVFPMSGVTLNQYVGQRVEITGSLVSSDHDPRRAPEASAPETETNAKTAASSDTTPEIIPRVNVTAVRPVSGSCK